MKNCFILLCALALSQFIYAQAPQPNIVFILVDDLNTYIEGYESQPQVLTPNLYELEQKGTIFLNAHAPAPKCAPSRTTILSGKDCDYTQVYDNTGYACTFRNNFKVEYGNEEVFTLPEYLKNVGGYYTYTIGKIFHCYEAYADFDSTVADPCARGLSWNDAYVNVEPEWLDSLGNVLDEGIPNRVQWAKMNDSIIPYMEDEKHVTKAIEFIQDFADDGTAITCGRPFFLGLGIHQPHSPVYIPETFFPADYMDDLYAEPWNYPYNNPVNSFPYNGVVMPPQPEPMWADWNTLGYMGKFFASTTEHNAFKNYPDGLAVLPEIDPFMSVSEKKKVISEAMRANAVMAYMSAVQFMDYEVGRFLDELESHPEIYNNTVIIFVADHGFSLGTKKHWGKYSMWETDMRVPMMYVDLRNPNQQVCNKSVSSMDIFPTVLDMLNLPEPTFLDGSRYLDGFSFLPLTTNPEQQWNKASIGNVRVKNAGGVLSEGNCFSQYSVKENRFHYIEYHTNNHPPLLECDAAASETEMELYDIGEHRETDPNEWVNLINNPAYAPVRDYMQEYLPGGDLYKVKPLVTDIYADGVIPCLLKNSAKLKLKFTMYNDAGTLITGAALNAYTFTWTNSLTAATFVGKTYSFLCSSIPPATFAANSKLLFYLKVTENATGKLISFTTETFYLNPSNKPALAFNLETDVIELSATVIDYMVSGVYTNSTWDFSDGTVLQVAIPGTHVYAAPGNYPVKNTLTYGNGGCTVSKSKMAYLLREGIETVNYSIYPNPATNQIHIAVDEPMNDVTIEIINILGEVVYTQKAESISELVTLDVAKFAAGDYLIKVRSSEWSIQQMVVIQH